jgi:hypothetical protein
MGVNVLARKPETSQLSETKLNKQKFQILELVTVFYGHTVRLRKKAMIVRIGKDPAAAKQDW